MGGGGGGRRLRRSRSASSRASMRRLYSRILWECLPAGMCPSSFCLFQQILQFVQALLQLVLLTYSALELDGPKLGVGDLIGHRGGRSLRPILKHRSVEVLELCLDLPNLHVGATFGGAPGSLRGGPLAILCIAGIVSVAKGLRCPNDAFARGSVTLFSCTAPH